MLKVHKFDEKNNGSGEEGVNGGSYDGCKDFSWNWSKRKIEKGGKVGVGEWRGCGRKAPKEGSS